MSKYKVLTDYDDNEFHFGLTANQVISDGDLEPDLIASLQARGVIQDVNAPAPKAKTKSTKKAS